ncbi:hypothetical protein D3Z55_12575 [Clostridiaceae bacterium]|jgi:hypothetical protein|nr:hypothetical protein [Lachnospiraceae bacterium]NBH18269.1 hypothetical protein [Clostridiaceae bacterium]
MKNLLKKCMVICTVVIMTLSFTATAYAQVNNMVVRTYQNEDMVGLEASPRGELISTIILELSSVGSGKVDIHSEIMCHEEMDTIKMSIKLQKLGNSGWTTVNTQTFDWKKSNFPNTDLSMAIAEYRVGALAAGEYRITASYVVYNLDRSMHESKTVTSATKTIN